MIGHFRKGMRVKWNRGQGIGRGRIADRFDRQVECVVEGAVIRRNGSPRDPAFLIQSDCGDAVLKLSSELTIA